MAKVFELPAAQDDEPDTDAVASNAGPICTALLAILLVAIILRMQNLLVDWAYSTAVCIELVSLTLVMLVAPVSRLSAVSQKTQLVAVTLSITLICIVPTVVRLIAA